jgi:hypothetical protein
MAGGAATAGSAVVGAGAAGAVISTQFAGGYAYGYRGYYGHHRDPIPPCRQCGTRPSPGSDWFYSGHDSYFGTGYGSYYAAGYYGAGYVGGVSVGGRAGYGAVIEAGPIGPGVSAGPAMIPDATFDPNANLPGAVIGPAVNDPNLAPADAVPVAPNGAPCPGGCDNETTGAAAPSADPNAVTVPVAPAPTPAP